MGAYLDTLEINHPSAKGPRYVRLSRNIRRVIDLQVHDGWKLVDALGEVGITRSAYLKASSKTEFKDYQSEQLRVLREHAARRSIARIDNLADSADSEHVQLEASKWLAGLEGIAPVQRTESIAHHVHHTPGLVIIRHNANATRMIADQVHEAESVRVINEIDQSVPADVDRNETGEPDSSGEIEGQP